MNIIRKLLSISLAALLVPAVLFAAENNTANAAPTAKSVVLSNTSKAAPAVPAPAAAVEVETETRGQYDFNPPCPQPRGGFYPVIEDQNRIDAMNDLLGKIYRKEKLPFSHDGIVFQNKEGRLPQMPYGYYHEYTLLPKGQYPATITIGGQTYKMGDKLGKRGAERLIIGGGQVIYYTFDHYKTFIQLQVTDATRAITRGQNDNPGAPQPGRGFSPNLADQNRVNAINDLLGKIRRGESFPYSHDGIVFQNKEGRLPQMPYGYYHEYTLLPGGDYPSSVTIGGTTYPLSPKLGKRGNERIIIGGGNKIYYTMDHYKTFVELQVVY